MANITESTKWESAIYLIDQNDFVVGGPDGISNVQARQLANRTQFLKETSNEVAAARGGKSSIGARFDDMSALDINEQNMLSATLKYAMEQAAVANYSIQALKQQLQQEGELTIINRGIVAGCALTKSGNATRNLSMVAGYCFANGRRYPVNAGVNIASVPPNGGSNSVNVYAYLYLDNSSKWKLAVTAIEQRCNRSLSEQRRTDRRATHRAAIPGRAR
jgi:hypothetical protein